MRLFCSCKWSLWWWFFSQDNLTFDVVVLHSLTAKQTPSVLCCIFLSCSSRTTFYDAFTVKLPSILLPVQQHQDSRATVHYILYLLSKSLQSDLISFGNNQRQRFKKGQKSYVATQNKSKNITTWIDSSPLFCLLSLTCFHAWVTWHGVFSCSRYKERIFHCAETAKKPARFLTEYSIQTLKKRENQLQATEYK